MHMATLSYLRIYEDTQLKMNNYSIGYVSTPLYGTLSE